jgi:serine/threonine protein kinase
MSNTVSDLDSMDPKGPDSGSMSEQDIDPMIGRLIQGGKVRIVSLIGKGGMGAVYLAENTEFPAIKSAVKVMSRMLLHDSVAQHKFPDEVKGHASLVHENIVKVQGYEKQDDEHFLILEYIDGKSLDQLIRERGALPKEEALPMFKGVLRALDYAHQNGIIHRDVKPANVLIGKDQRPKLTDFGIAKRVVERGMTATGLRVGTPEYMSPEQIQHPGKIDHRADVYAAGVLLFQMLTGQIPFDGDTEFAIHQKQVSQAPPRPRRLNSKIPRRLENIILKALEKKPEDRFQGCGEFLEAIEDSNVVIPDNRWKTIFLTMLVGAMIASVGGSYFYPDKVRDICASLGLPVPLWIDDSVVDEAAKAPVPTSGSSVEEPQGANPTAPNDGASGPARPQPIDKPPIPIPRPKSREPETKPPESEAKQQEPKLPEGPDSKTVELAKAVISNASQQVAYFCRDVKTLTIKEDGKKIAEEAGDSKYTEEFEKQISELNSNLSVAIGKYNEALGKLRSLESKAVDSAFEQDSNSNQSRYVDLINNHYKKAGIHAVDAKELSTECP